MILEPEGPDLERFTVDTPYFRPPRQGRSQDTLDRIASAALTLMEEGGVEGATVAAICKRAGASVGSFYARFEGKDDLIRYLQDRVWTEARERWDHSLGVQTWDGLPIESLVEGVVGLLIRSSRADFHLRRVFGRKRGSDPEAARFAWAFHEHILATVTPLFLAREGEVAHPDLETAVRFGYRCMVGAIREVLELEEAEAFTVAPAGSILVPESVGPELARMWMGYLSPDGSREGVGQGGEVDFFDPWG